MNTRQQAVKALAMIDNFIAKYKADMDEIGDTPTLQGFRTEMEYRCRLFSIPMEFCNIMVDRYY